jgi:ABC-type multidrug transport system fused ATPase/permease subunit
VLVQSIPSSDRSNELQSIGQRSRYPKGVAKGIAHRLSTIRNADCIYVMEHGQLVESGRHEELVELNRIYASLWRVQSGLK